MPGSEGNKGNPHSTGLVGKAASRFLCLPEPSRPLVFSPAVLENFVPLSHGSQGWSVFFRTPSKNYQGASGIRGAHPPREGAWRQPYLQPPPRQGAGRTTSRASCSQQRPGPGCCPSFVVSPLGTGISRSRAATARGPRAFAAFQCEVSHRGRSLQWGDFQISSPRGERRSFERLM